VALLIGGRIFAAMKRALGAGEWIRRGLGVAMLAGVAAIATGLDTGLLARVSTVATGGMEQKLVDLLASSPGALTESFHPGSSILPDAHAGTIPVAMMMSAGKAASAAAAPALDLPVEGRMPSLAGAVQWLNSPPLSARELRGKVVLLDIWTYSCINCLRTLPYVKAWASKYKDDGLVVIGVHSPEFAFERDVSNVKQAVKRLGITYPVAIDSRYAIWRALNNEYWPADYLVDAQGRIRYHHFGEGDYRGTERVIRQLLAAAGHPQALKVAMGMPQRGMPVRGVQAAPDDGDLDSPETYIGYDRAESFSSPGGEVDDASARYTAPAALGLNDWALAGNWRVGRQYASLQRPKGRIVFRFH
ncbi:MAG: thioredoxin family protein, partial [Acetobacteraceae bacterium]